MAQPTNTFSTYDTIGQREDLSDVIYDISPTKTPFMSSIAKVTATNTNHEWQTDGLAAASASNFNIEGDEATTDARPPTVRLGNYTAISDKVCLVAGTNLDTEKAGRGNEMDYQKAKSMKELKRDVESALLNNNAKVAGNDTTARELAGVESWIATNTSAGGSGADPTGDGTDARTDGTQRAFTEALLQGVIAGCADSGGEPDVIMVGSFNKQALSAFTGNATRFTQSAEQTLMPAIDVYKSDFGELQVVYNRFSRARSALVLDTDMWAMAVLRDFQSTPLAKSGDYEREQVLVEYTLEAREEAANGIVADLTTS